MTLVSTNRSYHIHEVYIENGPSWIKTTWNWLAEDILGKSSDYTLTNLVAGIWSLGSTVITAVKNADEAAWNGIKAVGEFISNLVLEQVISLIKSAVNLMMKTVLIIMDNMLSISYTESDGIFDVEGLKFGVKQNGLDREIYEGCQIPLKVMM